QDIGFETNELAECKWSSGDVDYESMENSFQCNDNLGAPSGAFGYLCTGNLPINSSQNDFYIRCKDQPWLESVGRGDERVANTESFIYTLKKPENHISIDKIKPDSDFEVSTRISTVVLKVKTAGGGDYHSCDYSFSSYNNMVDFNDFDFDNIHEQEFTQMTSGNKRVYIECEDETGDKIRGETRFRVVYDSSAPQVARVFQRGRTMTIITNENADCKFSTDSVAKCRFNFDNGDAMGGGTEHTFGVIKGRKYYIKCEDDFGRVPSGCSIIVRAT
ncbi:hypothetical protein CL614_07755, partial [archaeon]|nr:hypothetical protein [archaeon]